MSVIENTKVSFTTKNGVSTILDTSTGEVELSKWNKEVWVKFSSPFTLIDLSKETDKYKLSYGEYAVNVYEIEGGLEYEIQIGKIPSSNVFILPISSANLDFFYQPELTQKQKDAGCVRPENIIGSYAVYHSSKMNNEYGTGKAFHIYRPLVTDAQGKTIWGTLNYDGANLTVTIDQDWLDKAKYPVTIDPLFGYDSIGVSMTTYTYTSRCMGCIFTTSESGTATNMSVVIWSSAENYPPTIRLGIYLHSDLSLIAQTGSAPVDTTIGWTTFSLPADVAFDTTTSYLLWVAVKHNSYNSFRFRYDSGDANQGHTKTGDYTGGLENPLTNPTHDNNKYSIYCTYTVEEAEATTYSYTFTDSIGGSDVKSRKKDVTRNLSELSGLLDILLKNKEISRSKIDKAGLIDYVSIIIDALSKDYIYTLLENAGLTDTLLSNKELDRVKIDDAGLTDYILRNIIINRLKTDNFALLDYVLSNKELNRTNVNDVGLLDYVSIIINHIIPSAIPSIRTARGFRVRNKIVDELLINGRMIVNIDSTLNINGKVIHKVLDSIVIIKHPVFINEKVIKIIEHKELLKYLSSLKKIILMMMLLEREGSDNT